MLKVIAYDPKTLIRNPAIMARAGAPSAEKVGWFAQNFAARREDGRDHQLQPGVVRIVKDPKSKKETVEIIVGSHRAAACNALNDVIGPKEEPYMFYAVPVQAGDEQALIDAITENEYRVASDIFDRAEAMQKLVDMGVAQKRIATIFGLSEGAVSQALKAGSLDKKFKAAVRAGDVENDAAVLAAGLPADDTVRAAILEEAIRHRNRMTEISDKVETRKLREQTAAEVEAAKTRESEIKATKKDLETTVKEAAKEVAELDKQASKTKDVAELQALREKIDAGKKALKMKENELKKTVKAQDEAAKLVEKAKQAKEAAQTTNKTSGKVKATQEDVKAAAVKAGVKGVKESKRTRQQFIVFMEAAGEDGCPVTLPASAAKLMGKIEQWLDAECDDTQLLKAFASNCKS